jgi:hypothetical protein
VINNLKGVCDVGGEMLPSAPDLFWLYGKSSNTPGVLVWSGFMERVTGGLGFCRSRIVFLSFIREL